MGSPTTIHPFPELRAYAESEARAFAAAWESACDANWLAWERLDTMTRERRVAAHLTLLCDLTHPASRDAVCRLVAKRVGIDLAGVHQRLALPGFPLLRLYDYCGVPDAAQGNGEHTPAEALTLIVRHLWPPENSNAR